MIFVDTVAWLYLFDHRQKTDDAIRARKFANSINEPLCTSDLVTAETYKWLIYHERPLHEATNFLQSIVLREMAVILPIEQDDRLTALKILDKYNDQQLSYEDATTAALAIRYRIKKIFSFDRHFLLFPGIERVPN